MAEAEPEAEDAALWVDDDDAVDEPDWDDVPDAVAVQVLEGMDEAVVVCEAQITTINNNINTRILESLKPGYGL